MRIDMIHFLMHEYNNEEALTLHLTWLIQADRKENELFMGMTDQKIMMRKYFNLLFPCQ